MMSRLLKDEAILRGLAECTCPGRSHTVIDNHSGTADRDLGDSDGRDEEEKRKRVANTLLFHLDGAHTEKSVACSDAWFRDLCSRRRDLETGGGAAGREGEGGEGEGEGGEGEEAPFRVLVFYCSENRPAATFLQTLSEPGPRQQPAFDLALFCHPIYAKPVKAGQPAPDTAEEVVRKVEARRKALRLRRKKRRAEVSPTLRAERIVRERAAMARDAADVATEHRATSARLSKRCMQWLGGLAQAWPEIAATTGAGAGRGAGHGAGAGTSISRASDEGEDVRNLVEEKEENECWGTCARAVPSASAAVAAARSLLQAERRRAEAAGRVPRDVRVLVTGSLYVVAAVLEEVSVKG